MREYRLFDRHDRVVLVALARHGGSPGSAPFRHPPVPGHCVRPWPWEAGEWGRCERWVIGGRCRI
jgi:hypothetical protein